MHEDTEDKMFRDLLSDYAAPAEDNGFSDHVLANLEAMPDHGRLKTLLVGGAGIVGAALAGLQLPGLWNYIAGIKVPVIQPISAPQMETGLLNSSYGLVTAALLVIMLFWIGNNILFGEDM